MAKTLTAPDIQRIQLMRFNGATNQQIISAVPNANDSLIGTYAPSELRGGKRRLAEYIGEHPGIDFKDIHFRAIDVDPHRAAGQINDLRRAGLLTFKEGRIAVMRGEHGTAGNSNEKGMYNITLTEMGVRRVKMSKLSDQHGTPQVAIAEKLSTTGKRRKDEPVQGQVEAFEEPVISVAAEIPVEVNGKSATMIAELVTPVTSPDEVVGLIESAPDRMKRYETQYPILTELRRRAGRIDAANRLVNEALSLYDKADLTEQAVDLLEHLSKTQVVYTPLESEYLRFAEEVEL